jgi:transcription termination factor Rho
MKAKARLKKIEYWIAETEDGQEIPLNKNIIKKYKIKEGQEIEGEVEEKSEQCKYSDGTWSRSYQVFQTFKIK